MPDITLRSNAAAAIRGYLPPAFGVAGPLALNSAAVAMIVADEARATIASDAVTAMSNLVPNGPAFAQTVTSEQPGWATDADLGRETMTFSSTNKTNLLMAENFDYSGPHTIFAIAKKTDGSGDNVETIAGYFDGGSERAALLYRPTSGNNIQHWYGSAANAANPQTTYVDEEWNLIIGSYDGTSGVSVSVNGAAATSASASSEISSQPFYIGQPDDDGTYNLAATCSIDAVGLFNLDCFGSDPDDVALLAAIKAFCTARMGELITLA